MPDAQVMLETLVPKAEALVQNQIVPDPTIVAIYSQCVYLSKNPTVDQLDRAIRLVNDLVDRDYQSSSRAEHLLDLAELYNRRGQSQKALEMLIECASHTQGFFVYDVRACDLRIDLLRERHSESDQEIETAHRDLLAKWQRECPPGQASLSIAQTRLANFLTNAGKYEEAEQLLTTAESELSTSSDTAPFHRRLVCEAFVALYKANGNLDRTLMWEKRLLEATSVIAP